MTEPALLHLGCIKTATTFLQREIFSNETLGMGLPGGGASRAHLIEHIVLADPFVFDAARARDHFAELEAPLRARGLLPVWSDETLLGNPLKRRYDGHANGLKIAAAFPEARILITIREQKSAALSMYREYINHGGAGSFRQFVGTGDEPLSITPILRGSYLRYDRVIAFYQTHYGAENVLVLPQEMLSDDPEQFFRMLGQFANRPLESKALNCARHNVAMGAAALQVKSVLNRFFVSDPLNPHPGLIRRATNRALNALDAGAPASLNRRIESRRYDAVDRLYAGAFAASNNRTAALTGLDLEKWGYELSV